MADIIDIVATLTYNLNDKDLNEAIDKLRAQATLIEKLKSKYNELVKSKATAENPQQQAIIQKAIESTSQKIDKQTESLRKNSQANKQLQHAVEEEVGLIEQLTQYIKSASKEMATLTDPAEIKKFNIEIENAKNELKQLLTIENNAPKGRIQSLQEELSLLRQRNATLTNPVDIARGNQQERALQNQIKNLQQLGVSARQTGGIINGLNAQIDALSKKKLLATTEQEIKSINKEISELQSRLKTLNNAGITNPAAGKNIFGRLGESALMGLGIGTGFGLVTQGISLLGDFISDSSELAEKAEGVQRAFNRLNKPDLLDDLREATKGTVSDLELMRKAIQFENFGLPLEKLAGALEFARRRAKDTGDDINYITESLVNGIARQSPRILDNLGINAKRVSSEFKKTGDFAKAAFKIIQEESQKAGEDLETFSEKQAKLNAQIQNQQELFGRIINDMKGAGLAFVQDFLIQLQGQESDLLKQFNENLEQTVDFRNQQRNIQINADALYIQDFLNFTERYKAADRDSRDEILKQANDFYIALQKRSATFYGKDTEAQKLYLASLSLAYKTFNQTISAPATFNLSSITVSDINQLTKEDLLELQAQITKASNSLTSADKDIIERYKSIRENIQRNLDAIDPSVKKDNKDPFKAALDIVETSLNTSILTDELLQRLDDSEIENNEKYRDIYANNILTDEERRLLEENSSREQARISNIRNIRLLDLEKASLEEKELIAKSFNNYKQVTEIQRKIDELNVKRTRLEKQQEQQKFDIPRLPNAPGITIPEAKGRDYNPNDPEQNKGLTNVRFPSALEFFLFGNASTITDNNERLRRELEITMETFSALGNSAQQAYSLINQAQLNALDTEIAVRRERVANARVLAEQGNIEALNIEQERLEKTLQLRKEAAQQEQAINAAIAFSNNLLALSYAIVAVAKAGAESGPAAPIIIPAVVAALLSGYAFIRSATQNASQGFFKGGYTGDGDKHREAGVVHKKEFVMPHDKTAKYRDILEMMYNGSFPEIPSFAEPSSKRGTTSTNSRKMERQLDQIKDAVVANGVKNNIVVGKEGLAIITDTFNRRERRRWS